MMRLTEENFYRLLEVDVDASPFEIVGAYKDMKYLYGEDSLASYSFFSGEERREILAKLDEAYSTLMDEEKRSRYDRSLMERDTLQEGARSPRDRKAFRCVSSSKYGTSSAPLKIRKELKDIVASNPVIQEILSHDVLSGEDLKKIREALGISLELIGEITKVRLIYLRAIEEDEFNRAPSRMFLRSFLKSYAQSIGLDAATVATRYLKRIHD